MSGVLKKSVIRSGELWPDEVIRFEPSWGIPDAMVVWYVEKQHATPFRRRHAKGEPGGV